MKFLPLRDFVTVTSALNFDTPDCHVTGGCDLYTTKPTGQDKKLYKNIDKSLESQHAALLKFGASLSPPQRREMAASLNLSRSSPFGSLAEISSRRTFAYLIATLNASHPDYDFSHVLRPSDFKREKSLRKVMNNLDSTLGNVRPRGGGSGSGDYYRHHARSLPGAYASSSSSGAAAGDGDCVDPVWGPQMWAMIDKEMTLNDCVAFSYQPAENPFDEEEEGRAIWALHYFFFNKALKRVAYLYVRGVPVTSHSPRPSEPSYLSGAAGIGIGGGGIGGGYGYRGGSGGIGAGGGSGGVLGGDGASSSSELELSSSLKRRGLAGRAGAHKRARFWLGDRAADRVKTESDDEMDDGLIWNRTADGEFEPYSRYGDRYDDDDDDDYVEDDDEDDDEENEDEEEEEGEEEEEAGGRGGAKVDGKRTSRKSPVRGVSEDIASRMEIE